MPPVQPWRKPTTSSHKLMNHIAKARDTVSANRRGWTRFGLMLGVFVPHHTISCLMTHDICFFLRRLAGG